MVSALVNGIFEVVFSVTAWFINLITTPFFVVLNEVFPDLSEYNLQFNSFLSNYVFRGVAFARELFLNFTGMPRDLYYIWVTFMFGIFIFYLSLTIFLFIRNAVRFWKRGL